MRENKGLPGEFLPKLKHSLKWKKKKILLCKKCSVHLVKKRWQWNSQFFEENKNNPEVEITLCPGCQRLEAKRIDGIVELKSPLLLEHKTDVLNLIKNEETKSKLENPANRIFPVENEGEKIIIKTTSVWLARQIGRKFKKAYHGKLTIKPSLRQPFVRVYWEREK